MNKERRRKKFIGSSAQKRLLLLIFFSAIIPAGIAAFCLYYLIFNMLAWQMGIPENIAYNLLPVARKINLIILFSFPVSIVVILLIALELSNKMLGPLIRLENELDERIAGEKDEPIQIREKDVLKPLIDKINRLLYKEPPSQIL